MTQPADTSAEDSLTKPFDLRAAFLAKQNALRAALQVAVEFTAHGTTIGDASEVNWTAMLSEFLPNRYGVGPVFAVDSLGRQSQQIDVAVYDRQYAPLWFRTPAGVLFVPAESIYAAFEVKPEINKSLAEYAGDKIASVRALHRTSARIRHAGGHYDPQDPANKPILGGLLAVRSGWSDITGKAAVTALTGLDDNHRIDVGIALDALAFDIDRDGDIAFSEPGTQLIYFAMRLFDRLRELGTALAIEVDKYEMHINSNPDSLSTESG
ncbi:DUF6602 domain-containing protein [Blastococcus sp. CCUG 61487]|uniref:DUF6602 domain-containing protein n=1 Tax=Blastococcus sp. CCUG 61487 TaxID=1840703 RepID=UPI0010C0F6EC|nr:DUF6602 domain-containing protein [Blastococcus sp. CCUG 61487]TKJ30282.1 hypothetical protein A6V29_18965 [Blastococcus sp. CCUG 61487]